MDVLLRGGQVIGSPDDGLRDILVVDGRVAAIAPSLEAPADCQVVDCSGRSVTPGFIDLAARLCEPGFEYKETLATGSRAAAAGGFTTVCCLPTTNPINDTRAVTEHIVRRAAEVSSLTILPMAAATRAMAGAELTEYGDLFEAGACAVTDADRMIARASVMRRALEYARTFDLLLVQHPADRDMEEGGVMHEGPASTRLGLRGIPAQAESVALARDLELVALTGAPYHASRLSSARSIELMLRAKDAGLPVTCSVAAHHLLLTDEDCASYDTSTKVRPPFRTDEDRRALLKGLADGVIDCVVSDHAPQSAVEKEGDFGEAEFGAVGLEAAAAIVLSLVGQGGLSLGRAVDALSSAPARVVGPPLAGRGRIVVGDRADLCVVDLEGVTELAELRSRSKNSPILGRRLGSRITHTVAGGRLVFGGDNE